MFTSKKVRLKVKLALRLRRAVHLVWQSGPGWTIASVVLLVIQGILPLLSLYLMKLVLDKVTAGLAAPDKGAVFGQVAFVIGLSGTVALVSVLCRLIAGLVNEGQVQVVTDHMHGILQAKSVDVDLEYYENSQYLDTLHRAQEEAPYRPTRIVNGLVQLSQSGISLLATLILLLSLHWGIAIILFVATLPGVLVRINYASKMYRWQRKRTPTERFASYFNLMLTTDLYAKEIRLFDLGPFFMRRFCELRQQLRQEKFRIAKERSVTEFVTQSSATLAIFASYAFIAYRTVHGTITLGDLVMYYQAFQRGQGFLQEMLSSLANLYEDSLFLSYLYEFLDLKRQVAEPLRPKPVPRPMQTGIVFDHVSFNYPMSTRKALEDVTLTIRPGEVVALVGENGSGKTTLIKLLCRLYEPTNGKITVDGIDLRLFQTAALRREISVIFQDYARFYLTARENISFGNINLPSSQERILAAARDAGADDVINRLPRSYETILGKWFEEGEELSIGQWQKVALARAFMSDAQIIVLDEPTSAIDAKAEYEIFEKFRQIAKGQTTILISHRLSTVKMADCIYVLDKGRIVESGSHNELIQRGGTYARLFEIQARNYK